MAWALLGAAIAAEVAATSALKASDGFTRLVPSIVVVVGYALSFGLLALVLKKLSVSTTYAVWSGVGTAAIALIGIVVWNESAAPLKLASIAVIVVGVIALQLAGGR